MDRGGRALAVSGTEVRATIGSIGLRFDDCRPTTDVGYIPCVSNPSTIRDLVRMTLRRKRFWLIPFVVVLGLLGLIVFAQGSSIAPFVYTLF